MVAGEYVLQQIIEARLQPRSAEVRHLRDELVPAPMREVWGLRHPWALTLDSENLRLMQGTEKRNHSMASQQEPMARQQLDPSYIMAGVLEEGRALLDAVQLCARLFGRDHAWAASLSLVDGLEARAVRGGLRCVPEAESANAESGAADRAGGGRMADLAEQLLCSLKFGTQGLDAMAAIGGVFSEPRAVST